MIAKEVQQKKNTNRFSGTVVSTKMKNTILVEVGRFVKHPKYGKSIKRQKRYPVDTGGGDYAVGDKVIIEETRPISKTKHFRVVAK